MHLVNFGIVDLHLGIAGDGHKMGQIFGNVDTIDGPVFLNCRRMTESGPAVALGQVDGPFGKLNNLGPLKFRHA